MSIKRNPATGKIIVKRFSMREIEDAMENYHGFCIACGSLHETVEPDARRYHCTDCGLHQVYGAEEIVMKGLVKGNAQF